MNFKCKTFSCKHWSPNFVGFFCWFPSVMYYMWLGVKTILQVCNQICFTVWTVYVCYFLQVIYLFNCLITRYIINKFLCVYFSISWGLVISCIEINDVVMIYCKNGYITCSKQNTKKNMHQNFTKFYEF